MHRFWIAFADLTPINCSFFGAFLSTEENRIIESRWRIQSPRSPLVRRFLVVVLVLVLLALALGYRDLVRPATPPAETLVEVVPGMGTRAIGALLAQRGIIRSQFAFDVWHVVRG